MNITLFVRNYSHASNLIQNSIHFFYTVNFLFFSRISICYNYFCNIICTAISVHITIASCSSLLLFFIRKFSSVINVSLLSSTRISPVTGCTLILVDSLVSISVDVHLCSFSKSTSTDPYLHNPHNF